MAAQTTSITAPTGGWNARDSLGEMPPNDAITLQNIYPTPSDVMQRKGYTNFSTGMTGQINSLINYASVSSQVLFAAVGAYIYNVSAGGAVGAAVVSSLTSDKFKYQNITTSGGNFVLLVNGADKLQGYNGTSWWVDGDGAHDITGVDTATINSIMFHQNRIWLIQKASLTVWYLGLNSIAGAATAFNLSTVTRKGGYVIGMESWTIDAGQGMNNYAVFFTSMGEIIVYSGTDPGSATTWTLTGVWALGAPVSNRGSMKWGGDLLLITYDGLVPMAQALQSSRLDPRINLTDKIYSAISNATNSYGGNFGWDLLYYAKANMLIINIPAGVGSQQQYVMNTITKSWCNFTNWNANCWCLFNDEPYFGSNGVVCKAWSGFSDNDTNITSLAQQAFNYLVPTNSQGQSTGTRAVQKRITMARPILFTNGSPSASINVNMDYSSVLPTGSLTFTGTTSGQWGISLWGQATWGQGLNVSKNWYGVQGIGYCMSINLSLASKGLETHWAATDIVWESGGIL